MRALSTTVLTVITVSCGIASCGVPESSPGQPLSGLPAEAGPLDSLSRRHARLRQRMRQRGYREESGLSRFFVLEDRGTALPLDLGVTKCSTFLALGGGTIRDLELSLYDGEGEEAATSAVDREGGLVHVCPQAQRGVRHRPYYLAIRSAEGAGAIMVAHFRSEPGAGDGFDGLFEGLLAPRVPFRDVEEHVAASRSALRARGFAVLSGPVLVPVREGGVVRLPVHLDAGRCYVAVGRAGEGLTDIDLFLFDRRGVEVARDLAVDAQPSIEHCPEESGHFTTELRAFEGAGAVAVMVFAGPAEEDGDEPPEDGVEASLDEHTPASHDPSLAMDVLAAPLLSRGFSSPLFISRDASIVPGEVRTHDVVVGPGCALIAGTASHEGMDLDLYLADRAGREIDRDTAVQSTARVRVCRPTPSVMTVAVKGYGRDGTYALAVLRAPATVESIRDLRMEEVTAPYRERGYEARLTFEQDLGPGGTFRRPLPVDGGACVAVATAGDDRVSDVDLYLRDEQNELVTSESGPFPYAAALRCATEREVLTIEVQVTRGRGAVSIQVLTAQDDLSIDPPAPGATEATPAEEVGVTGSPGQAAEPSPETAGAEAPAPARRAPARPQTDVAVEAATEPAEEAEPLEAR